MIILVPYRMFAPERKVIGTVRYAFLEFCKLQVWIQQVSATILLVTVLINFIRLNKIPSISSDYPFEEKKTEQTGQIISVNKTSTDIGYYFVGPGTDKFHKP